MNEKQYEEKIGQLFFELEEYIQKHGIDRVNIRFPRGIIRTADFFRDELHFIDDYTFKTNIAYHLMLTDVYRWLLNRFDISFTAQEMLIKVGIVLLGSICGDLAQYFGKKLSNNNDIGINASFGVLKNKNIIDVGLKKRLKDLWGQRNKIHISSVRMREYMVYDLDKYNEAVNTWIDFKKALKKAHRDVKI